MAKRIYAVESANGVRLVEAISRAHAIDHVVSDTYEAFIPTQRELLDFVATGLTVEQAEDPTPRAKRAA